MKAKFFKRILFWVAVTPILIFATIILIVYLKQDAIVQSQIATLNTSYKGEVVVGKIHLAPFKNFPDVSIKIEDITVHESKGVSNGIILDVANIYIGFNIWDIVAGNYDIHSLIIEDGLFDLILHKNGKTNVENALALTNDSTDGPPLDIHLQKIELKNIDVNQREEATNTDIGAIIYSAKGGIYSKNNQIEVHVDSEFELTILKDNDTTYFKQKHFDLHTDLVYDKESGVLVFKPSAIKMEHGDFELKGSVDTKKDMTVDIEVHGTKPSFDMFIAFAPKALIPVLESYKNAGKIFFNATIKGPTTEGRQPLIDAQFGAKEAYLENLSVNKRIDKMGFSGHFTNGKSRNLKTMEFSLTNITANLENGSFVGAIEVKNFESPEIDMQIDANFDIPFVVSFLNLTKVKNAKGKLDIKLKFHDIIDLKNPQKALDDLNQAYYAELIIKDLTFNSNEFPAPLKDLDIHLEMNGKQAQINKFNLSMGNSNLDIKGSLSDLPAIVHQSTKPVNAHLEIKSNILDIAELTRYSEIDSVGINERIENLSLAFSFNALGNAFTEFKHLPKGEFFIDDLYADLKQYPHTLHDFHADILINNEDLNVIDFSGVIDKSDFHFNGLIYDYSSWMQDELDGNIDFDITLKSNLLKFENLFTFEGENYVPKEYRQEEIEKLDLHLKSTLRYQSNKLSSIKVQLDKLGGKMKVHPLRFENFNGTFQYEKDHLMVQNFKGKIGLTEFEIGVNYYLGGKRAIRKKDNSFSLKSDYIDFDALSNYNTKTTNKLDDQSLNKDKRANVLEHAEAFNIYELPFPNMQFNVDIEHFIYHKIDLKNIKGQLRTTKNHYIHIDTINIGTAGGEIALNGYFNGKDPKNIFLKPNLKVSNVDLEKLLFKFENFGQDVILSEKIHGQLNASINGKIRIYPDLAVDLSQSEVHLDAQILNGRLEKYDPILMLSDYFGDKNLTRVQFDTLKNHVDIVNGTITIPNMTIESTLGHMDISGKQDLNTNNIDYYVRIPMSVLRKATKNKIFGAKESDTKTEDEIIKLNTNKKIRYLNLNISGTIDDYQIKVEKEK